MLVVETVARIRREYFVHRKSIKEIVRTVKVSRNTVRKVIRSGASAFSYDRSSQPRPKIDPWRLELDEILAGNARRPKRERLTLVRIYEELRNLRYDGGYDAVRRYLAVPPTGGLPCPSAWSRSPVLLLRQTARMHVEAPIRCRDQLSVEAFLRLSGLTLNVGGKPTSLKNCRQYGSFLGAGPIRAAFKLGGGVIENPWAASSSMAASTKRDGISGLYRAVCNVTRSAPKNEPSPSNTGTATEVTPFSRSLSVTT
jgi:hypothetical protein